MRKFSITTAIIILMLAELCFAQVNINVTKCKIPGLSSEIISRGNSDILVSVNSKDHKIDIFKLRLKKSSSKCDLIKSVDLKNHEPTSVAAHPKLPIAIAVALKNGEHKKNGKLFVISLADKDIGKIIHKQDIPPGPDSIAISPNGLSAVIAIEAEEDNKTPGKIIIADLTGLENFLQNNQVNIPILEIKGLEKTVGKPASQIEPEFVAISEDSKLTIIGCQENNIIILVDLNSKKISGAIRLPKLSEPDGVAVTCFEYQNKSGYLIAAAEEGKKHKGKIGGQCVSFYFVEKDLSSYPQLLSRFDVRPFLGLSKKQKCNPEGVTFFRIKNQTYAAAAIEKKNKVIIINVTNPAEPKVEAVAKVGVRPEGIIAFSNNENTAYCITGNEGKGKRRGSISIIFITLSH